MHRKAIYNGLVNGVFSSAHRSRRFSSDHHSSPVCTPATEFLFAIGPDVKHSEIVEADPDSKSDTKPDDTKPEAKTLSAREHEKRVQHDNRARSLDAPDDPSVHSSHKTVSESDSYYTSEPHSHSADKHGVTSGSRVHGDPMIVNSNTQFFQWDTGQRYHVQGRIDYARASCVDARQLPALPDRLSDDAFSQSDSGGSPSNAASDQNDDSRSISALSADTDS